MDEQSLKQKVETIYRSELTAYKTKGRRTGEFGTFSVRMQTGHTLLSDEPNHDVIHSRSATAMLKLYSSLNTEHRERLLDILTDELSTTSEHGNLSYLTCFVLFRCGRVTQPIRKVCSDLRDDLMHFGLGNALGMLANQLTFEYDAFSAAELTELQGILTEFGYDHGCSDRIAEAQMRNLELELADVNPEINSDRDKVVTFWEEVFHSNTIPRQLELVDELFEEGSFDEQKLAVCLDRVRVFLIIALQDLSVPLASERGLALIPDNPEDGVVMNWYVENNIIGTNQKKLIRAIYGLTSREGSHSASSRREYARIAKNVAIECIIMMIGLVQN